VDGSFAMCSRKNKLCTKGSPATRPCGRGGRESFNHSHMYLQEEVEQQQQQQQESL
jgi:hypothetical protein